MRKPVIEIKNLEKVYEGAVPVHAVNGINLIITEGEFTALKGPSGCGKTTLLNLLGGLDQPTSGTIEIGGVDITTLSENELIDFRLRNIGFVFQAYNLIPVLSAKENVSSAPHCNTKRVRIVRRRSDNLRCCLWKRG